PLFSLFWVNLALGSFNLFLPALPLDGGRVFRSLLSFAFGYSKATIVASKIGSFMGLLLFIAGLISGNLVLMVIAAFIFFGSREEGRLIKMKERLMGAKLSSFLSENPLLVESSATVKEAFEKMLSEKRTEAVSEIGNGRFAVILLEELQSLSDKKNQPIASALAESPTIQINEEPAKAFEKIASSGKRVLPVLDGAKLVGTIDIEKIEKHAVILRADELLGIKPSNVSALQETKTVQQNLKTENEISSKVKPKKPVSRKKKKPKVSSKAKNKSLKKQNRK
ncbi:MAG: hypothetical protein QXK06_03040, partial [Candidatus Diapherotrites archaeon]